jgi:hypothetical protein
LMRMLPPVVALLCALFLPGRAAGQEAGMENPNKIKAAFLRNFAHYVTWPEKAFADPKAPWHVCVLGKDPFGEILDRTLAGRTEQGRPFEVYRAETLGELPTCQIVYVAYHESTERRAALAALKNRPALTVGEARDFLSEGGMIRFQLGERVEMSINLDQARLAALQIQTKMLEVSHQVLESGTLRTLR